ncbi:hypothetical protein X777_07883 [Ooceraea biroi]|uniref:Uncharacterized protein n=1 Tax=Ooceraea biroi TaxID=2015173 RepID=A0A026WZR2_OOCBI|nr:hypothetical protein X777_07883 [Ooceraea biroi]
MMEISDDVILEREQQEEEEEDDDIIYQEKEYQLEEKLDEEILVIKEVKEIKKTEKSEEADTKIATFLHEKGLSENLIGTLINTGLTDEHITLLKVLNLNDDDIDNLQDLWQAKIEVSESGDSINSTISDESSSDGRAHLSNSEVENNEKDFIEKKEEEEPGEDWNYFYYGE